MLLTKIRHFHEMMQERQRIYEAAENRSKALKDLAAFASSRDSDYGDVYYHEEKDAVLLSAGDSAEYTKEWRERAEAAGFKQVDVEGEYHPREETGYRVVEAAQDRTAILSELAALAARHDEDYGEVFYRASDDQVYCVAGDGGDYTEEFERRANAAGFNRVEIAEEGCYPGDQAYAAKTMYGFKRVDTPHVEWKYDYAVHEFAKRCKGLVFDYGHLFYENAYTCNLYLVTADGTEEEVVQQLIAEAKEMGYTLEAEAETFPKPEERWSRIDTTL